MGTPSGSTVRAPTVTTTAGAHCILPTQKNALVLPFLSEIILYLHRCTM